MKPLILRLSFTLIIFWNLVAIAQNAVPVISKVPDWVTINPTSYSYNKLQDEAKDGYLDLVYEKQISLSAKASYFKKAYKILTEVGVENISKISVSYDPAYQKTFFHFVRVIRGNTTIEKLRPNAIKLIQQEKELDENLYDGSLSAVIILDDIRKGDILEYGYSIEGMNSIFNNKYAGMFNLQFDVPIINLYYKIITPSFRSLIVKNNNSKLQPSITRSSTNYTYEWKLKDVPSIEVQDNIPSWFDPYPIAMVSEFKNWKEVASWGSGLFPKNISLSPLLKAKVDEIVHKYSSNEGKALAALHFVQDEIRYMGIEMGTSSHKPFNPNQVFIQRFGDCKDKSYLLITMLHAMGMGANPVLINTTYKKSIKNWLPAANTFDHVTVCVNINGTQYWLDPTLSHQRGKLTDIAFPDYQAGLILSDTTENISTIPLQDKGTVDIKETIKIFPSGKAKLRVITRQTGSNADYIRNELQSKSLSDKKKEYVTYYKSYFDKITIDSFSYADDEVSGTFTTNEEYTITNVWDKKKSIKEFLVQPYVLDGTIRKIADEERTMPFSLSYPIRQKEEIEILLPEDWDIEDFSKEVNTSAFKLTMKYNGYGRRAVLTYNYETKKDFLNKEEIAEYAAQMKLANENMAFSFTKSDNAASVDNASDTSFSGGYNSLYVLLGLCVFITYMVKKRKEGY